MKIVTLAAALAVVAAPSAVHAQDRVGFMESRAVGDKPVVSIDPQKAYILVRADRMMMLRLLRVPDARDQARYEELRAAAFAEAREQYLKKKASYDKAKAEAAQAGSGGARGTLPKEPVEPTAENFEFTPFGMMTQALIGPLSRFTKSKAESTYLTEITPGTYRIYSGTMLTCYCLGSVKFDVRAGELLDLGYFDHSEIRAAVVARDKRDSSKPLPLNPRFRPGDGAITVDPRLTALKLVPVKLKPVGKLPNYFGLTIDRIPEIPGVIRYDRDRIVDLTGGN